MEKISNFLPRVSISVERFVGLKLGKDAILDHLNLPFSAHVYPDLPSVYGGNSAEPSHWGESADLKQLTAEKSRNSALRIHTFSCSDRIKRSFSSSLECSLELAARNANGLLIVSGSHSEISSTASIRAIEQINRLKEMEIVPRELQIWAVLDPNRSSLDAEFDKLMQKFELGVRVFLTQPMIPDSKEAEEFLRRLERFRDAVNDSEFSVRWGIPIYSSRKSFSFWENVCGINLNQLEIEFLERLGKKQDEKKEISPEEFRKLVDWNGEQIEKVSMLLLNRNTYGFHFMPLSHKGLRILLALFNNVDTL